MLDERPDGRFQAIEARVNLVHALRDLAHIAAGSGVGKLRHAGHVLQRGGERARSFTDGLGGAGEGRLHRLERAFGGLVFQLEGHGLAFAFAQRREVAVGRLAPLRHHVLQMVGHGAIVAQGGDGRSVALASVHRGAAERLRRCVDWHRMKMDEVVENVRQVGEQFAGQRRERQQRRHLDPADFELLREAGFPLVAVPVAAGGCYQDAAHSMRGICEALRLLARRDSSVALVASMHPAVIAITGWLDTTEPAPPEFAAAWEAQRRWVFETAREGHFWGTLTSEPGSGGDLLRTKATARADATVGELGYRLSGVKHFGSGSGVTSFIITTALPEGSEQPDWFHIDMRGRPWDGTAGVKLTVPWDGQGMTATQSHAMDLVDAPATRAAWPDFATKAKAVRHLGGVTLFAAVITGIVQVAMDTARAQLAPRQASLRAYEQVEWTRAEIECWLIEQAYEGMLRAIEQDAGRRVLTGKVAIAELAESCLARVSKVVGGGAYSRSAPYGYWYEDVRALGFLRPPWGLSFDQLRAE